MNEEVKFELDLGVVVCVVSNFGDKSFVFLFNNIYGYYNV